MHLVHCGARRRLLLLLLRHPRERRHLQLQLHHRLPDPGATNAEAGTANAEAGADAEAGALPVRGLLLWEDTRGSGHRVHEPLCLGQEHALCKRVDVFQEPHAVPSPVHGLLLY